MLTGFVAFVSETNELAHVTLVLTFGIRPNSNY